LTPAGGDAGVRALLGDVRLVLSAAGAVSVVPAPRVRMIEELDRLASPLWRSCVQFIGRQAASNSI